MTPAILEALANCKLLLAQPTEEVCWSTVSPERLAELHRIAVRLIPIEAAANEFCGAACDMNNFICRHHGIADGELYMEFLRLDDAQAIAKEKLREALTPTGATELLHTESDHERDEATPD